MATCAMRLDKSLVVTLDATEMETLQLHGSREGISVTDAMADLVEFALCHKVCEICKEEKEATQADSVVLPLYQVQVGLVGKPPMGTLTKLASVVLGDFGNPDMVELCTIKVYQKVEKGDSNVVEREDERNGTGDVTVSVN